MSSEEYVSQSQLSDFVDRVTSVTEQYPQMNEDNTKSKILRDFLELLGWDIAFDAELEFQVIIGTTKNYVDYALFAGDSSPVLFVEAKGYDTSLKNKHRDQLHSYLRQTDVDWGLLSNGETYEIYRRENVDDGVKVREVAKLKLEELPSRSDYVGLLTKDALTSGHSVEFARRLFNIRRAKDTLEREKENIAEEIMGILTETAGDVVSQEATTESKEMVDRLIQRLNEQTKTAKSPKPSDSFWENVENSIGISRTSVLVKLPDDTTATDDYVNFVYFLFDSGYLTREDLPIESGPTRYILNTENRHKNGGEMYNPKEVVEGVYLEAHQNTEDKKRRIVELGERFGEDE